MRREALPAALAGAARSRSGFTPRHFCWRPVLSVAFHTAGPHERRRVRPGPPGSCAGVPSRGRARIPVPLSLCHAAAERLIAVPHFSRRACSPQIRHLAAISLKKRILSLWIKLDEQVKEATKAALLERIVQEHKCAPPPATAPRSSHSHPEPAPPADTTTTERADTPAPSPRVSSLVRRAVADVVASIAKFTVPAGQWPLLLQFLGQCSAARHQPPSSTPQPRSEPATASHPRITPTIPRRARTTGTGRLPSSSSSPSSRISLRFAPAPARRRLPCCPQVCRLPRSTHTQSLSDPHSSFSALARDRR